MVLTFDYDIHTFLVSESGVFSWKLLRFVCKP